MRFGGHSHGEAEEGEEGNCGSFAPGSANVRPPIDPEPLIRDAFTQMTRSPEAGMRETQSLPM